MRKELLTYAIEGLKNRKNTTIPAFLVLCISFSFLIFATCLVGSISKTNDEFRINTYGEWYADILDAGEFEVSWASNNAKVEDYGILSNAGTVSCGDRKVGIGTVDESLQNIGRMSLVKGRWPQTESEVVMESDTLCALGYDYSLGQDISIDIMVELNEEDSLILHRNYTLVGIVKEYSDLWTVDSGRIFYFLNSIIISKESENNFIAEVNSLAEVNYKPIKQLFLKVNEENREQVTKEIEQFLVAYNKCAFEGHSSKEIGKTYIVIILLITMVAIMFTYLLQLKKQVYSYSVMRSVGMTKIQLARLVCYETLLICIPAIIIGTVIGSAFIFAVLKLLVYGGSISVHLFYKWNVLAVEIIMWFVSVLISRITVFFIAIYTPLIGHLEMRQSQKKAIHRLKKCCIFIICICFGAVIVFTGIMSLEPNERREYIKTCPSYVLWPKDEDVLNNTVEKRNMTDLDVSNLSSIPGCSKVYGFSEYRIEYPFEIADEYMPYLYVLDENEWDEVFHFEKMGADLENFRLGKTVYICFPKEKIDEFDTNVSSVDFSFTTMNGELIENAHAEISDVICVPEDVNSRLVAGFIEPYTILCSKDFIKQYGVEGYSRMYVYTNVSTDNTSTDMTMAEYCRKNNIFFSNRREEYQAYEQENIQKLVLLISVGLSVGLIFGLLLGCILSLEKEYQKRSYAIMRTLGMSKKQWMRRQLLRSIRHGMSSLIGGWLIFEVILFLQKQKFSSLIGSMPYSEVRAVVIIVSIIALSVPFIISILISTKKSYGELS